MDFEGVESMLSRFLNENKNNLPERPLEELLWMVSEVFKASPKSIVDELPSFYQLMMEFLGDKLYFDLWNKGKVIPPKLTDSSKRRGFSIHLSETEASFPLPQFLLFHYEADLLVGAIAKIFKTKEYLGIQKQLLELWVSRLLENYNEE